MALSYLTPSIVKLSLECPREAWLSLHHWYKPITPSMRLGIRAHELLDVEELRRRIGFTEYFVGLSLSSEKLGLRGVLDLAVRTSYGWAPVEYKYQSMIGFPEKIQTTLYALLLEECFGENVSRAYIVLPNRVYRFRVTGGMRRRALHALERAVDVLGFSLLLLGLVGLVYAVFVLIGVFAGYELYNGITFIFFS